MYGYIYETKDTLNNKYYIGKHISAKYDCKYIGSGSSIKKLLKIYGKKIFTNKIIAKADSLTDLNKKEIFYISLYIKKYGKENVYNLARGGNGGDPYALDLEKKEIFREKMTEINRARCSSEEFKNKTSERMSNLYKNPDERIKQRDRIKKSWSQKELRDKQSEHLKEYYRIHKHDCSFNYKKCSLTLGDFYKEFESVKALKEFLKNEYDYTTSNPNLKKMLLEKTVFNHPQKRFQILNGMVLSYIN